MSENKIPCFLLSTDIHLKEDNIKEITKLIVDKCKLAVSLRIDKIGILGDIFDSRIAQRQEVLNAWLVILDIIKSYKLIAVVVPGNHDKTNYGAVESFLSPFKNHPALKLIETVGSVSFDSGLALHFMPFYKEEVWVNEFNSLLTDYLDESSLDQGKHILLTHIAVNGSINNDGSEVESSIKVSMFKKFFKVFSGHYHDMQQIGKNFFHIPSIRQNNYGEDKDKGFTLIYSDGSHELIKSDFKAFEKISVDVTNKTQKELEKELKEHYDSDENVRVEFVGSESDVKAIKKSYFEEKGIDVKTKINEFEDNIVFTESEEVEVLNASTIKEAFVDFCEKNELDSETGLKYLKTIL